MNHKKKKYTNVIIVQRILSEYRKEVFDELYRHIDFLLLHSSIRSDIKQVSTSYSKKICSFQFSRRKTNLILNVFPSIFIYKPKIIIHEFSIGIVSLIPTFLLARILGLKIILWGHGYDRFKGYLPEKSITDKLRLILLKNADAVIFYGQEAKLLFSNYMNSEKLFVASNCLNTNILNSIRDELIREGRKTIKKRIGFTHEYNLIYIGRILKKKSPHLLLDIFEYLFNEYGIEVCIHFVGAGNFLNKLKKIVNDKNFRTNVKFYGELHDNVKTGELLYCSDLMIMPGPLGLSLNHAFNFDCPVVTFKQNGHGPEIEYLINGKTGYIVKENTIEALALIVSKYLKNRNIQSQTKMNIRNMIETKCSINSFIRGFEDAIEFCIKK